MTFTSTTVQGSYEQSFFASSINQVDIQIAQALRGELERQQNHIELVASSNLVSRAVLEAQGSVLTNRVAEGLPEQRYYGGCEFADIAEQLAIDRAKQLFDCEYANVQAHGGSQANQAVLLALCKPGDTIMGMALSAGGHLTHGAAPSLSGKWFNAVQYGVSREDNLIDFDEVERLARKHRPQLIIAGGSAYPRTIDFQRFRKIADEVDAYLQVDMAHFAGLVAGGVHPNPLPHAHVVTTTTHKSLRGARGGMILAQTTELAKKLNSGIFPGLQGSPWLALVAGKAVAFKEALQPDYKIYQQNVVSNAKILAQSLLDNGFNIVTGGTDTHLLLVDLRPKQVTGKAAEESLERAGITCNKNSVPFDPEKPTVTSGIRLGTPAGTSRGFRAVEFRQVGVMITSVLDGLAANPDTNAAVEAKVRNKVLELCSRFPIYADPHAIGVR